MDLFTAFLAKNCSSFAVCCRVNKTWGVYSCCTIIPFLSVVAEVPCDSSRGFVTSSKCEKYPKIFSIAAGSAAILAAFWYVRKRCTPVRSGQICLPECLTYCCDLKLGSNFFGIQSFLSLNEGRHPWGLFLKVLGFLGSPSPPDDNKPSRYLGWDLSCLLMCPQLTESTPVFWVLIQLLSVP